MIRALLVDDEPIARKVLREELEEVDDVEVIGEAGNGPQALEQIEALSPDLVFLDLQMPGMNGFEVVRNLEGSALPCIVIVTAFDRHAVEAFEAGAIDYLLKPVGQDRLARCLERVRQLRKSTLAVAESVARLQEAAAQGPPARPRKIVGKLGEEYHLLDSSHVLAFQAERELVWVVTRKQRYLATQPLKSIQAKLCGLNFARIHRNALVNLDRVSKMAPLSSQRWLLTLDNQQEFIVSKRQARAVQKLLSW
ncbi:MAG TPA: LytTR family DNA-binding domain-containing protein [Bryobacteraceae bacterium]|nr:LytTR family DNA-binding domain-containing protein [Bryobacteraceae bacterium]